MKAKQKRKPPKNFWVQAGVMTPTGFVPKGSAGSGYETEEEAFESCSKRVCRWKDSTNAFVVVARNDAIEKEQRGPVSFSLLTASGNWDVYNEFRSVRIKGGNYELRNGRWFREPYSIRDEDGKTDLREIFSPILSSTS